MPLRELVLPTARSIRWGALLGAIAPAAFLVWHFHNQPSPNADSSAFGLRLAALSLALGLAFVLDDPTEDATGYTPVSILARRTLRIALTLPPTMLFWLVLRAYAGGGLAADERLPALTFLLEVVAFAGVAFAGAAAGARVLSDRLGGLAGVGAVILVALSATLLPWGNGLMLRTPGTSSYREVAPWWWMITATAGLVWWRMSAPPGMPLWRTRPRRSTPRALTEPPARVSDREAS